MVDINQVMSNDELFVLSSKIIDLLKDCNLAEKWKIISSLHNTLRKQLIEDGFLIIEENKEDDETDV